MIWEKGRLGIEPKTGLNHFLKTALNIFCTHKTDFFFLNSFFFYLSNTMEVIIGIKPAPGDHKSNFKKVGSIPFGFNTMGTERRSSLISLKRKYFDSKLESKTSHISNIFDKSVKKNDNFQVWCYFLSRGYLIYICFH